MPVAYRKALRLRERLLMDFCDAPGIINKRFAGTICARRPAKGWKKIPALTTANT